MIAWLAAAALAACASAAPTVPRDRHGVRELYPDAPGGARWTSRWDDGRKRTFSGVDPADPWLDAGHGEATMYADGRGRLYVSGKAPRLYVVDPERRRGWGDVEMTVYAMRVQDAGTRWGGIVGVARTNHGVSGPELSALCDTRGVAGRLRNDGTIDFEKETSHPKSDVADPKELWSEGLPKSRWLGYKFVVYDLPSGAVKLELWLDLTDGENGGDWHPVGELVDDGSKLGKHGYACREGVDPALPLRAGSERPGSESGKPNLAVYWRSDDVGPDGLAYKKMSVREIAPPR